MQMKIEIEETQLELDQACAGRASAQRECALLQVEVEKTRAMLEREREESYTRTRLLGARPSSSSSSSLQGHTLAALRKEAIDTIDAGRDDSKKSATTAEARPSADLSMATVSRALSAGHDLLEVGLSEKRRIEVHFRPKLKFLHGPIRFQDWISTLLGIRIGSSAPAPDRQPHRPVFSRGRVFSIGREFVRHGKA